MGRVLGCGDGAGRLLRRSPVRAAVSLLVVGSVLAAIGYFLLGPIGNEAATGQGSDSILAVLQDTPHESGVGEAIGSGGFSLAVIGLSVLFCPTGLRWLVWPLRVLGSMPLTAYVAHLLVWTVWLFLNEASAESLDPVTGFQTFDPFWPMTLAVTAGCIAWALTVGRGPLETVVARLSVYLATEMTEKGR